MVTATRPANTSALKYVEAELAHCRATRQAIQEREQAVLDRHQDGPPILPVGAGRQDPTGFASTALAADIRLREMHRIVDAIDHVLDAATEDVRRLVDLWAWQGMSIPAAAETIGVSEGTAHRWRKGVLLAIAQELGWG